MNEMLIESLTALQSPLWVEVSFSVTFPEVLSAADGI